MTAQVLSLFPDLEPLTTKGIVYLMTDGYLLKFGWSKDATPKRRSGELRATIIGFIPGTREDERIHLDMVKRWSVGGEWFRIPDNPGTLLWLIYTVQGFGQWKGVPALEALCRVLVANQRHAA